MHFYTSVNINYLPKARILAKSVKEYCPESKFSLVFSDSLPAQINITEEPFDEILVIEELGIPVKNLNLWIFEHTVVELCTAVKGQALLKFLEEGSEKVVYLDPDIAVFNDLHELEEILDHHDIILTPHVTIPEENRMDIANNEICALKHGAYNFGFYAVRRSENGLAFARWWRDRLVDFCFDDIPNGIFTDQKWGDLVPCMFNGVHILRDVGYNVSTWNISHRLVGKKNDIYMVNDVPLKFYHFSGFDSGDQESMLNIYSAGNKHLYELREWYIKKMDQEEQELYGIYPSKYNFYDNGTKIEKVERRIIKDRLDVKDYFKDTNPYMVSQEKSYFYWFRNEVGFESFNKDAEELQMENQALKSELSRIRNMKYWKFGKKVQNLLRRFRRK